MSATPRSIAPQDLPEGEFIIDSSGWTVVSVSILACCLMPVA
jgi:hypothetical protein